MSNINDGGPAFPVVLGGPDGHQASSGTWQFPGLSMRDHFAGLAMQAVMTSAGPTWRDSGFKPVDGLSVMENNALLAYQAADAMIKARGGKP